MFTLKRAQFETNCEYIYISVELRFNHHFSNVYCIVFFNIIGWIETNDVMVLNLRILIQKNYLTSFNWCTYVISIHEIQNHKIIKIIKV